MGEVGRFMKEDKWGLTFVDGEALLAENVLASSVWMRA